MTQNGKDYSDYMKFLSNLASGQAFLAGFTFTVIVLLLTRLPDPSSISSQLVLFFLTVMFGLFMFLWTSLNVELLYSVKNIPKSTKRMDLLRVLVVIADMMSGASVMLIFLLWNLIYLFSASLAMYAIIIIVDIFGIVKPLQEYRRKIFQSED